MVFRFLSLAIALSVLADGTLGLAQQVTQATVRDSVNKGAAFLRAQLSKSQDGGGGGGSGESSLAAYALIKAGDSPTSAVVAKVVNEVLKRASGTNYNPGSHEVYAAGVELMLLEAAGHGKYQTEMQNIVNWLIRQQNANGAWDYVHDWMGGDTSQCQYALLGFWAAERSGIHVPAEVYDKAANWFIKAQSNGGGFTYHPYGPQPQRDLVPTHAMAAAAVSGLMLTRLHLYPNDKVDRPESAKADTKKFGVLETVDLDSVESGGKSKSNYKPTASSSAIYAAAKRSAGWLGTRFTVTNEITSTGHKGPYYLYTVERMAALLDVKTIAGHDWFREGAAQLMRTQQPNGAWNSQAREFATTSLAMLFLLRTTAKALNRTLDPLGTGLLAGGRGLPDDLNQAVMKNGKVETKKDLGPIDQLLAELEKVEDVNIADTQATLIEKVILGDREELIKQKKRLIKLAKHPNVEVRRTAIWRWAAPKTWASPIC